LSARSIGVSGRSGFNLKDAPEKCEEHTLDFI
jgi:hypothetical protein